MPICVSCRVPHHPEDCDDTQHARRGHARQCYCQHKPRPTVAEQPEQPPLGPEGEDPS